MKPQIGSVYRLRYATCLWENVDPKDSTRAGLLAKESFVIPIKFVDDMTLINTSLGLGYIYCHDFLDVGEIVA
jgi:hypothetical protein